MARIRIIDEWLRSPVSGPSRHRAIFVVADSWAEQRVLMRAFASAHDQTRPTIFLRGSELAIGPAGTDPHGPWGIHVQPPVDGRAQELRTQLELAARRLAGGRGHPARLQDEAPEFETKQTNHWLPGAGPALPRRGERAQYYEPAEVAPPSPTPDIPSAAPAPPGARQAMPAPAGEAPPSSAVGSNQQPSVQPRDTGRKTRREKRSTSPMFAIAPRQRRRAVAAPSPSRATVFGAPAFQPGRADIRTAGPNSPTLALSRASWATPAMRNAAASLARRHGLAAPETGEATPASSASSPLAGLVGRTLPLGFQLSGPERRVLDALGRRECLSASDVADIAEVADGAVWMARLVEKLAEHGLDLVAPGDDRGAEPTYVLRR